jgi:hypothetical protein
MNRRFIYTTDLSWGGDIPTAELEVEVSYEVAWGSSETGRFGPPENYSPGSDSIIEDIRIEKIEGKPAEEYVVGEYVAGHTVASIIEKIELSDRHQEAMLNEASEKLDAECPEN